MLFLPMAIPAPRYTSKSSTFSIKTFASVCAIVFATSAAKTSSSTITDFENDKLSQACHCCCYCSITDDEDSIDLHHGDFTILAIDDKNRMIMLLSPSKNLTRTIPINMICNMYFIEHDNEKGLVLLVFSIFHSIIQQYLNEVHHPTLLTLYSTPFTTVFSSQKIYDLLLPLLPFPSVFSFLYFIILQKEPITHTITKDTRSWWTCLCDYCYSFVDQPDSYQSTMYDLLLFILIIEIQ